MYLAEVLIIAIGLSMDTFAVSMASGLCKRSLKFGIVLRAVLFLGTFQALFAALGWLLGQYFQHILMQLDHWIAFVLLVAIGGKMIWESIKTDKANETFDIQNWFVLLGLSVATSIDALIVGMGLGFLSTSILQATLVIGAVTIIFATAGFWIARRFGLRFLGKRAELIGGVVLITIGIKVLIEHLA